MLKLSDLPESPLQREMDLANLDDRTLVSREVAAVYLGMAPRTLEMRACRGQPPGYHTHGRNAAYRMGDLRAFIDGARVEPKPSKPKRAKAPAKAPEYSEGFERFWTVYPKKRGKPEAWKAWQKLDPNEHLTGSIIRHLETRVKTDWDWIKDGGQFIPMPSTFLNQHRFEDEWKPFDGRTNTQRFNEMTGDQWVREKEEAHGGF